MSIFLLLDLRPKKLLKDGRSSLVLCVEPDLSRVALVDVETLVAGCEESDSAPLAYGVLLLVEL